MTDELGGVDRGGWSAPADPGGGGGHVAVVNAVFAGLASLYLATRSVLIVLLGVGLAILLVVLALVARRDRP
jgi:hypothetical protein